MMPLPPAVATLVVGMQSMFATNEGDRELLREYAEHIAREAAEAARAEVAAKVRALIQTRGGLCRRVGDVCGQHGEMWYSTGCEDEPRDLAVVLAILEAAPKEDAS